MSLSAEVFGSDSWVHKLVNTAGLGIPGWADRKFGTGSEAIENALGDVARQTADEGGARTIVYGRVRPIGGNLIYCQAPQTRWVQSFEESQGKGGGDEEQEVWTERVYRTYALGICEGPISRIVRVWGNNKLIYDARDNSWGARNNGRFLASCKIYLGGFNQLRCPELQAIWGSDIPAHRGTAYIVFINQDLTEFGGAVPQYQFEVERAEGTYFTSKPYAVESIEAVESMPMATDGAPFIVQSELMEMSAPEITGGELRMIYLSYDDGAEAIDGAAPEITDGELRTIYKSYTMLDEGVDAEAPQITEGELRVGLIEYTRYPDEALDAEPAEITGGSLT